MKNSLQRIDLPPPVKASLHPLPPLKSVPPPDLSTPEKRGAYLVRIGGCADCHTPKGPDMQPLAPLEMAGGFVLRGPWGEVAASNITPDPSGIPYYTEAMFVDTMRTGRVQQGRKLNSIMPWGRFRNLTDQDLKAIFAHLRTLKPISHRVDNTEPPTPCKRCGQRHGLGADNAPLAKQ